MKKWLLLLATLLLALGLCQNAWATEAYDSFQDYGQAVASLNSLTAKGASDRDAVASRLLMRSKKPIDDLDKYGPVAVVKGPGNRYTLQFAGVSEAVAAMEALAADENVRYVEQDAIVSLDAVSSGKTFDTLAQAKAAAKAASPYMSWGAKAMGADELAASITSAGSVTVAVVDTGVARHSFLNERVKLGGMDFADPKYTDGRHDVHGHGTHVAGTIVDLTQGLKVNILPVRVLGDSGSGSTSAIANGILYAVEAGAKVVNMSLGGVADTPYISNAEKDAVDYAYAKGVTVVVAAGNESMDASFVNPASFRNCVTVAALEVNMTAADYSNFGDPIDVAAPGSDIVSCSKTGGFINMSGTSMASPHVAAIAAMVKLKYPGYSPARIDGYIKDNCLDLGATGWDRVFGYGMPCFITNDAGAEGDYTYRVVDGEASITGYTGADTAITLPTKLGGLTVTAIDESAFKQNTQITSVTVPGSIQQIGAMAFQDCAHLQRVILEKGVTKIGASAFENCTALSDVSLPDGLRDIDSYAFDYCSALVHIELPQTLVSLGAQAFGNSALTELNIPGTVKTIPSYLAIHCVDLTSLTINEGTVRLDSQIISFNTKVKRIDLPKTVTTIGVYGFAMSGLETISMPGVVDISMGAFYQCSALREVTLAEGLETLPENLFLRCTALEKVSVPRSVVDIDKNAVAQCPNLKLYVYKGSQAHGYALYKGIPYEYVGYQYPLTALTAMYDTVYVEALQRFSIDALVDYEPAEAQLSFDDIVWLSSNPAVAKIVPPDDEYGPRVELVGEGTATITGASVDGSGLRASFDIVSGEVMAQNVRIDKTEATLKTGETMQLTAVVMPDRADQTIFWTSSDQSVATVTEGGLVTAVGTGVCIIGAQPLEYADIGAQCTVTVVGDASQESGFTYVSDAGNAVITGYTGTATEIEIPAVIDGQHVRGIAAGAFKSSAITSVRIPEGVTYIEQGAFRSAKKLKSVSLPETLQSLAKDAFKGCKKLPKVKRVDFKIIDHDGVYQICPVFTPANTASSWSISASGKNTASIDGDSITPLTDEYFKITLKAGGKQTTVGFRDGLPYAASKVAIKGKSKRTLTAGNTMTLGYTVTPSSAQVVAMWVSDKPEVATVDGSGVVTGVAPGKAVISLETDAGLSAKVTVTVKRGKNTIDDIDTAPAEDFTYVSGDDGVVITGYIGTDANVGIPAQIDGQAVVGIGAGAFKNSSIANVRIPEGVTHIAKDAFRNAKKLKSVSLPDSLKSLAKDAFKGCAKLPAVKRVDFKITGDNGVYGICPVFTPANTASSWSISASGKNTASIDGNLVTPLTDGYFKLTLKAGGKKSVTGFQNSLPYAASKISINGKTKRTLKMGKTLTLASTVTPASARIVLRWESANPAIATVDENGVVTAVAPGKVVITLQSDVGLSDKVTVTVKE